MKRISRVQGAIDDVAISGDLFRMERMDKGAWWVAVYRGDERVAFSLVWNKKRREIVAILTEDTIPPAGTADA